MPNIGRREEEMEEEKGKKKEEKAEKEGVYLTLLFMGFDFQF